MFRNVIFNFPVRADFPRTAACRLILWGVLVAAKVLAQSPSITEYPITQGAGSFEAITTGPDGALWLAGNSLARLMTNGTVTSFALPGASCWGIVSGPDGALWFTDLGNNAIGRISTAGVITEYPLPVPSSFPEAIAAGPDGALWFSEAAGFIGRITTAGVITVYPVPTPNSRPAGITAGPDGALWFTESALTASQIGRITTAGAVTEYPAPTPYSSPLGITVGPDGALWFTETRANNIGRITTAGVFTEYPIPLEGQAITAGPDGALWFTEEFAAKIARITLAGVFSDYPISVGFSQSITPGPDGALWFSGSGTGRAAMFVPGLPLRITTPPSIAPGTVNVSYAEPLAASDGTPPYTWSLVAGSLPAGLLLSSGGTIAGTPSASGTATFMVQATDANSATVTASVSLTVSQPICNYSFSNNGSAIQMLSFPPAGGSVSISVNVNPGCQWTVSQQPAGSTVSTASGTGAGFITFTFAPNYTASAVNGTLTIAGVPIPVQQQAGLIASSGFMPHLAAEGGWNTTFTLVNKGAFAADTQLSFLDNNGNPLPLPLSFPQDPTMAVVTETSADQTIPANGLSVIEALGPANVPYFEGSAQVTSAGAVDGFAIFHYDPTAQEAVVPLQAGSAGTPPLVFDNTNGVLTGVALNLISSPGGNNVGVTIYDDTGALVAADSIIVPVEGHISFVLSTQFPVTANIRGILEFDPPIAFQNGYPQAAGQLSVLGIRYTPPGTLTTIPAPFGISAGGGSIAHVASGSGWETTFVLFNSNPYFTVPIQLSFFDGNGNALSLPLTFPQTGATSAASSVTQSIAPNASLWIQSSGSLADALLTGSAQLTTTGTVSGYAIFRYLPNGQEAVVPLETRNAGAYLVAFDNTNGTVTGLAVSAVSTQATIVPVLLRDDSGAQIAAASIPLAANGHVSEMMTTLFPAAAEIRGTVEFDTPPGAQIGVIGIRSPPALTFTTLPALAK